MIRHGLGARSAVGYGLGVARAGGVVQWYRAGGAPLPVAAYQPKGAASLAASYINLANPGTYDAVPIVIPNWSAETGWSSTGSQCLNTNVVMGSLGWTFLARWSDATAPTCCAVGARNSGTIVSSVFPWWGWGQGVYANGGALVYGYGNASAGVGGCAGATVYKNGIALGVCNQSTLVVYPYYILAYNNAGSAAGMAIIKVQACVFYHAILTDTQVGAISAAMAAL
jgi:hypothetical protein